MRVFNLTIESLVDENYIYARALDYLGIEFYLHPDKKLKEICQELNLDKSHVLKTFYLFDQSHRFSFKELNKYPLEIVIEYLKHSHHLFIKEKLPFIARLIHNYSGDGDLRLIFPEFVEEFINHIYEEEDIHFTYILNLIKAQKEEHRLHSFLHLSKFANCSLRNIHEDHCEEDELAGIRNLVEETNDPSILWQVISKEIKAFDREMWYHAEIENKILFPKAIALERAVIEKLDQLSKLN